jgi:hypothetical protein
MANSTRLNIPILAGTDLATRENITTNLVTALEANAAALSDLALEEVIAGHIATVEDKTYWLGKMPFAGTITKTVTQADSGTATATFFIGSTALGGTANSVSASEQEQAHSTDNAFAVGDILKMVVSSNSTCLEMRFSVYIKRTAPTV